MYREHYQILIPQFFGKVLLNFEAAFRFVHKSKMSSSWFRKRYERSDITRSLQVALIVNIRKYYRAFSPARSFRERSGTSRLPFKTFRLTT